MHIIFLIGYRGTGKTTVARLLADKLSWQWSDADEVLQHRFGRSIRQIFADEGELGFRDKESAVLEDLAHTDKQVVATGGGIILRPENREKLKAGKVVWLTAPTEVLWKRLQNDATTADRRPNLTQGGHAEIEELLKIRLPLYAACADWQVDTSSQTPEAVADAIHHWYARRIL